MNIGLKEIGEAIKVDKLQFYSARHSWAKIARNKCNVSKDDISMALNLTDPTKQVTDYYIDIDWSILEKAQYKVMKL